MNLLVVIGAGASYDCWPNIITKPGDYELVRLPLAKSLFSPLPRQDAFLQKYNLMGLASKLRSKAGSLGDKFDVEAELALINNTANERGDSNTLQNLFKTRFYLHGIINNLSETTLYGTHKHTVYVDLLSKLKDWIDESQETHFVDIVTFNYDDLIEKAMENVYGYDWERKNENPLSAYYAGKNLRIYKPHGSINWGREILKDENHHFYQSPGILFREFEQLNIAHSFQFVEPNIFTDENQSKNLIPAIAVPFKEKTNFDECPQEMQIRMLSAVQKANKVFSFGWRGGEKHFTEILKSNKNIDEAYIINPSGKTELINILPTIKYNYFESPFSYFINGSATFENILSTIK